MKVEVDTKREFSPWGLGFIIGNDSVEFYIGRYWVIGIFYATLVIALWVAFGL